MAEYEFADDRRRAAALLQNVSSPPFSDVADAVALVHLDAARADEFGAIRAAAEDAPLPPCDGQGMDNNARAMEVLSDLTSGLNRIASYASTCNATTKDLTTLRRLISEHESAPHHWSVTACSPGAYQLVPIAQKYDAAFAAAGRESSRAVNAVFAVAEAKLKTLEEAAADLVAARSAFDEDGTGGVKAIFDGWSKFKALSDAFAEYRLPDFRLKGEWRRGSALHERHSAAITRAVMAGGTTDLDACRDEYFREGLKAPHVKEFTRIKRSTHYSFQQLNTGDYPWAVLTDTLLARIDSIHEAMVAAGYRTRINSAYRNPARSNGASQHQYGTAVDWQVFDFDGSGGPRNKKDWQLLADLIAPFGGWIEPISQSGPGHVHVDFRFGVTADLPPPACGVKYS